MEAKLILLLQLWSNCYFHSHTDAHAAECTPITIQLHSFVYTEDDKHTHACKRQHTHTHTQVHNSLLLLLICSLAINMGCWHLSLSLFCCLCLLRVEPSAASVHQFIYVGLLWVLQFIVTRTATVYGYYNLLQHSLTKLNAYTHTNSAYVFF